MIKEKIVLLRFQCAKCKGNKEFVEHNKDGLSRTVWNFNKIKKDCNHQFIRQEVKADE